jgi:hypothetical protein
MSYCAASGRVFLEEPLLHLYGMDITLHLDQFSNHSAYTQFKLKLIQLILNIAKSLSANTQNKVSGAASMVRYPPVREEYEDGRALTVSTARY